MGSGPVHALCGVAAGKSTFLSTVMGIQERDGGTIRLEGREVRFSFLRVALAAGVSSRSRARSPR